MRNEIIARSLYAIWNMAIIAFVLLVIGCASQPQEAQLATACNSIAAGYNTAAAYKAQGKLPAAAAAQLTAMESGVKTLCDPTNPPADLTAALAQAQQYLTQITLANAGVK